MTANLDFDGATVLHYGEGRAYQDTDALQDRAFLVDVYEPDPAEGEDWKADHPVGAQYQFVVSVYVLNVLTPDTRESVIHDMRGYGLKAYAAVRTDKIKGVPMYDGVLTRAGTFQKSFSLVDANRLGKVLTWNPAFAIVEL